MRITTNKEIEIKGKEIINILERELGIQTDKIRLLSSENDGNTSWLLEPADDVIFYLPAETEPFNFPGKEAKHD